MLLSSCGSTTDPADSVGFLSSAHLGTAEDILLSANDISTSPHFGLGGASSNRGLDLGSGQAGQCTAEKTSLAVEQADAWEMTFCGHQPMMFDSLDATRRDATADSTLALLKVLKRERDLSPRPASPMEISRCDGTGTGTVAFMPMDLESGNSETHPDSPGKAAPRSWSELKLANISAQRNGL
jgi:hypothetical protein